MYVFLELPRLPTHSTRGPRIPDHHESEPWSFGLEPVATNRRHPHMHGFVFGLGVFRRESQVWGLGPDDSLWVWLNSRISCFVSSCINRPQGVGVGSELPERRGSKHTTKRECSREWPQRLDGIERDHEKNECLCFAGIGGETGDGVEGHRIITNSPRVLSHRLVTEQPITTDLFIGIMADVYNPFAQLRRC
ncbi:hypothetical protein KQX54_009097 [Cotesia glomerata]|uniref:Uncharacterized protein n=1 Tax=Cotesia glomerata TaxID=32391 RepID=A0AAV7IAQ2_COTGL|nr:hypothetical protein KQX54_009097 [Cotesia glomerata]